MGISLCTPSRRGAGTAAITALLALALPGCATTFSGAQEAPAGFAPAKTLVSYNDALWNHSAPDARLRGGRTPDEYREYVIGAYLVDIEVRYQAFRAALLRGDRESAFTGDMIVTILAAFTALARPGSVDEWATATAFASGARSTIDKRLFFDRTMPAVVAAIDVRRARIEAQIAARRRLPADGYPLSDALSDLRKLAAAGNLSDGVDRLVVEATAARDEADAQVNAIRDGCSEAGVETAKLNGQFIAFLREDKARQAGRVAEAARLLDMPAGPPRSLTDVATAFDDRFCGDAGKAPFIADLKQKVRTLEGGG